MCNEIIKKFLRYHNVTKMPEEFHILIRNILLWKTIMITIFAC